MNDPDQYIKCRNAYIYFREIPYDKFDFWTNELHHNDEIAYWRKCWNIREDILNIIGKNKDAYVAYEYPVSYNDLLEIIKTLKSYNRHNWNTSETQNLWEWRDIKHTLKRQIKTLIHVAQIFKKDPCAFTVMFYDSY